MVKKQQLYHGDKWKPGESMVGFLGALVALYVVLNGKTKDGEPEGTSEQTYVA